MAFVCFTQRLSASPSSGFCQDRLSGSKDTGISSFLPEHGIDSDADRLIEHVGRKAAMVMRPRRDPVKAGQESVWGFPRSAIAQPTGAHIRIMLGGRTIAESCRAIKTIETSHPATYYLPPDDIDPLALRPGQGGSFCEWKSLAIYHDVVSGNLTRHRAAWSYSVPTVSFAKIGDHLAFYAGAMDACFVDREQVAPQAGGFYGGWITSAFAGPFKGAPGSMGW